MKTYPYLPLFLAFGLLISYEQALAQYKTEQIKIDAEDHYGYVEVCTDCSFIRPEENKTYSYLKDQQIESMPGEVNGALLHGKAFLFDKETNAPKLEAEYYLGQYHNVYKEWLSTGELTAYAEYQYGLKHGRSFTYVFGVLESEETFNKGVSESLTLFTAEGLPNIKIEYIDLHGIEKKIKTTYYTDHSLVEAEGLQVGEKEGHRTSLFNGQYKKFDQNRRLVVKGNYLNNQKHGDWNYYFGDVVNERKYEHDRLVSETFTKNGELFTGIVTERYTDDTPKLEIAVKNGIREGKTIEYTLNREPKVSLYKKGKLSGDENFDDFISKQKILSEQVLKHQCDQRGGGLFVDKMQHTKDFTIVYMHTINVALRSETSLVYTAAPGNETSFTLLDNLTNQKLDVLKIFKLNDEKHANSLMFGEMRDFVLVFNRIPETTKNISLMEGNEPFTISETGQETYHWGCYDLVYGN